jgi:hypothetical protein
MKQRNRINTLNIPGLFQDAETGLSVFVKIYDVSDNGLGIYSADQLTPGQVIIWITLNGEVRLNVQWCNQEDPENHFPFRVGLRCEDPALDLYEVMKISFDTQAKKTI